MSDDLRTDGAEAEASPDVNEERLAEALRLTDQGLVLPGDDVRDELRAESRSEFEAAGDDASIGRENTTKNGVAVVRAAGVERGMARRWLPSLTAVVVLGLVGTWLWQSSLSAAPTFGDVVKTVQGAKSLKLHVTQNGRTQQVFVLGGDSLRWVESEGHFQIVRGDKLWRVDERTQRFTTDQSVLFDDDGLDLFELLGVAADREAVSKIEPIEGSKTTASYVYNLRGKRGSHDVAIEAVVSKDDARLRSIRVFSVEIDELTKPVVLCELEVEAFDEPLDDSLFVVAKSLTEDYRIGKIVDSEGIVTVKPVMHERWTPVSRQMILKRGDWLRTDPRGPNAVAVRVDEHATLTLGPGSLVELIDKQQARVHRGQVKVQTDKAQAFEVFAGKAESLKVEGQQLLRLVGDAFKLLTHTPMWLAGFEGTQSDESLGSLIANVDGRDVPLTVGYHKVTVEIRDQIARTTIEESFVNHTNRRLEGVFYFPLPQDASISGFGMWIGNELVEADVVEKQRAREIYETILREKRDPGLLEWNGGNIFKARVFPIFAHSQKRIKITYTQVLPLRGNSYRYSYGLQSEMLKQNPLSELSIDLKVNSAMPLRKVDCPSHAARIDRTQHAAHIEFNAQEYTPDRDFEAVFEVDGRQSDVVVIPHRRGDDGYFMVQLTPPAVDGNWQRDFLPDGQPLKLLVLADTSASMDDSHRKTQDQFIASLLMSLGPQDQFNLAACDVDCIWAFDAFQAVGEASPKRKPVNDAENVDQSPIEQARDFLANRVSLGWTDLDRAFASVVERADEHTHVIYIGDGVVTAGSADPNEFVNRFKRLVDGQRAAFHAVTVGNSYDPVVLKTIASVGGGSFRQVTSEQGPQAIAKELLGEIARPGLKDLNIEIRGIRVARLYPDELPNIVAGTQQIIIGRYLPEGKGQRGEIVVTGKRGEETVRYSTRFSLADAESGNSFIPRLWARLHLDKLLEQGSTAVIRDEIIALSEEYHIMTPYTSLLVLESDADRERFKVKRRFTMRDGEKFFAKGRDDANYELKQKQMKLAGLWRQGLRTRILRSFTSMGRDTSMLNPYAFVQRYKGKSRDSSGGWSSGFGNKPNDYGFGNRGNWDELNEKLALPSTTEEGFDDPAEFEGDNPDDKKLRKEDQEEASPPEEMPPVDLPPASTPSPDRQSIASPEGEDDIGFDPAKNAGKYGDKDRLRDVTDPMGSMPPGQSVAGPGPELISFSGFGVTSRFPTDASGNQDMRRRFVASSWMQHLFPEVGPPNAIQEPAKLMWPDEAVALSNSLLRVESIRALAGLQVEQSTTTFDPRWNRTLGFRSAIHLDSPNRWLNHSTHAGQHTLVFWCDEQRRGVHSKSMLLGQIRKSVASDRAIPNVPGPDYSLVPLHRSYAGMTAKVENVGPDRHRLVLSHVDHELRVLIDSQRHVILAIEEDRNGKPSARTTFREFIKIGGRDWATKIETFRADTDSSATDNALRRREETTLAIKSLSANAFAKRFDAELIERPRVQFLNVPLPDSAAAREARTTGRATFEDHVVLANYFQSTGQMQRVREHVAAMTTLAGDHKPGMWHVQNLALQHEDHEILRQRLVERARELATNPTQDDLHLANHVFGIVRQFAAFHEQLQVLNLLKPVFDRQPDYTRANRAWQELLASVLPSLDRAADVVELRREIAVDNPFDYGMQTAYAYALVNTNKDYDKALAWLRKTLTNQDKWRTYEEDAIRTVMANFLENCRRYAELLEFTTDWMERRNNAQSVYSRHLTALVWNNQIDKAEATIRTWFEEAVTVIADGKKLEEIDAFIAASDKPLPNDVQWKLSAALSMALGQGYNLYTYRIDPKWLPPLSKLALAFARQQTHRDIANQIVSHQHFANTEAANVVREQAYKVLNDELDDLPVVELQTFLRWTLNATMRIELEEWTELSRRLEARWAATNVPDTKHSLGVLLHSLNYQRLGSERQLAFLRTQTTDGPEVYRTSYIALLFNALFNQEWSDAFEAEAFALLPKLNTDEHLGDRMPTVLPALYRLTDNMISHRYQQSLQAVDHETKANRIKYRAKQVELYREARADYIKRLAERIAVEEKWLADWMRIERVYLSVKHGDDLKSQARACIAFLGDAPPNDDSPPKPAANVDGDAQAAPVPRSHQVAGYYAGVLRHRYLMTAVHLATLRGTTKVIANDVMTYLDAGIAQNPLPPTVKPPEGKDDPDGGNNSQVDPRHRILEARNLSWKSAKYQLLIALDRPEQLERDLHDWIVKDRQTAPWRLSLARVLAEQGRLEEAVRLYEAVERADELRPTEYAALSSWYMTLNLRDKYSEARVNFYATMGESRINQLLTAQLRKYQATDGSAPATLDPEVLLMFQTLMQKSTYPANYVYHIGSFYHTTRDFRLFRWLPLAALGKSAGHAYSLAASASGAMSGVLEEATVDEIVELLRAERDAAKSPVDRRALDLLEVVAERQAIALKNQPGPHIRAALAALQRAFDHEWADGEHMQMANYLVQLGTMPQPEMSAEQIRQLRKLHEWSAAGSFTRLQMADQLAGLLWNYSKPDDSLIALEAAIHEFDDAQKRRWPSRANHILEHYFTRQQSLGRYADTESVILDHLTRPADAMQALHFNNRLDKLYYAAWAAGAQVSIGKGETLYHNYVTRLLKRLDNADDNVTYQLVLRVIETYRAARRLKYAGVSEEVRAFAFTLIPELLKSSTANHRSIAQNVGGLVREFFGPVTAIRFVLDRIDEEPPRFRYHNDNAWTHHSGSLGFWLYEAKRLLPADLETRLFKLVITELRRDLESNQQLGRYMYGNSSGYFWVEKKLQFLEVAEELIAKRKNSGDAITYIAGYLFGDVGEFDRAIEILFEAHRAERLNDNQIGTLVSYLHGRNRYGESVMLLEGLVQRNPNELGHRSNLMYSYYKTERKQQLLDLLTATDSYYRDKKLWSEQVMSTLGASCASCLLWEQSATYLGNAIMEHRRASPDGGIGNGMLSNYYSQQATAFSQLGRTREAVDAAASAVVSWGRGHKQRVNATYGLTGVFVQAKDRDDYAVYLDAEAKRTGQDRPVVRKALGIAYQQLGDYKQAAVQLKIAADLQPNDEAIHRELIACYDRLQDRQSAIDQTLALLQLERRNVDVFADLGKRLAPDPKQQERAFTSMVEMKPNESDSHTKLAQIRESQDRWPDAIQHWRHVVRIRTLEPTGLIGLIQAQLRARRIDDARKSINTLETTSWPSRFGSMTNRVGQFRRQLKSSAKDSR